MIFGLHVDVYTRPCVPPHMHAHTYMSYRYNSETEHLSSMYEVLGLIPSAKSGEDCGLVDKVIPVQVHGRLLKKKGKS